MLKDVQMRVIACTDLFKNCNGDCVADLCEDPEEARAVHCPIKCILVLGRLVLNALRIKTAKLPINDALHVSPSSQDDRLC